MIWAMGVHPTEPNTVIGAVGLSSSVPARDRGIGTGSVIRSDDGGESWTTIHDQIAAVEQLFVAAG